MRLPPMETLFFMVWSITQVSAPAVLGLEAHGSEVRLSGRVDLLQQRFDVQVLDVPPE